MGAQWLQPLHMTAWAAAGAFVAGAEPGCTAVEAGGRVNVVGKVAPVKLLSGSGQDQGES